jgi:hypothetical protein
MERRIFLKILAGACATTLDGFPDVERVLGQTQSEIATRSLPIVP